MGNSHFKPKDEPRGSVLNWLDERPTAGQLDRSGLHPACIGPPPLPSSQATKTPAVSQLARWSSIRAGAPPACRRLRARLRIATPTRRAPAGAPQGRACPCPGRRPQHLPAPATTRHSGCRQSAGGTGGSGAPGDLCSYTCPRPLQSLLTTPAQVSPPHHVCSLHVSLVGRRRTTHHCTSIIRDPTAASSFAASSSALDETRGRIARPSPPSSSTSSTSSI